MAKARDILKNSSSQSSFNNWFAWMKSTGYTSFFYGLDISKWIYQNARHIGWFIVTTGMITALPLIFEIKRESLLEEMEKIQIDAALSEGRTPQELYQSGLVSAVEPKVL